MDNPDNKYNLETRRKVEAIICNLDRVAKADIHIPSIQFEDWWKENADLYLKDIDLLQEGCFSHCENAKITDTASDIVDRIYEQPETDLLNSTMIMLQYLYEKYKLEPMDCEILGQLITVGLNLQTKFTAESICKAMLGDDFDIEAMLSEAPPVQKRGNAIDMSTHLTPGGRAMKKSFMDSKASYAQPKKRRKERKEAHYPAVAIPVEIPKDRALMLIDDFINGYFHPHFIVGPDGARPAVVSCGLILLHDLENNRVIDKNNCSPTYLPKMVNGKAFAYPVIDIINNAVEEIMRKSKCTDALQEVADQYKYAFIEPCTFVEVEQELNKKLTAYINSPAMFCGEAGLRFEIARITRGEMNTRL